VRLLYLGISGVLHPSASVYELVHRASPWSSGHTEYEATQWLASALTNWPDVKIVLTSTQPKLVGLPNVLARLGPLAERVIGYTFEDLTANAFHQKRTHEGIRKILPCSVEDYWRMSKAQIVLAHMNWRLPQAWVAVDDEDGWPAEVRENVCVVDGCSGLIRASEQERLLEVLSVTFD
jgi:hypothetical protein